MQRIDLHLGNLLLLDPKGKLTYAREKADLAEERLRWLIKNGIDSEVRKLTHILSHSNGHSGSNGNGQQKDVTLRALKVYMPKVYPGCVTLFRASKRPAGYQTDPDLGWGKLAAGGVEIHEIPGYHGSIVMEPRVRILAEQLQACLSQANMDRSSSNQ